jgi:5-hydroxyisourate hydrolase
MGLSTHILDTALGKPATNVVLHLYRLDNSAGGGAWSQIGSGRTDNDGRCKTLLGELPLEAVTYKILFETSAYFRDLGLASLYPYVEIVFTIVDPSQHYHIPLLLTANGYTTYRGS